MTSSVPPFDNVAVAVNWLDSPTTGAAPLTVTEVTAGVGAAGVDGVDGEGDGLVPHPARSSTGNTIRRC